MAKESITENLSPEERIVKAARKLFMKHGVGGVSTDMLAAEAKTSKMTMYKYFPDKTAILKAFLEAECGRIYRSDISLPETKTAYRETLIQFGVNLLTLLSDPEILRFDQLMLSQANAHPKLAQVFYDNTYQRTCDQLREMLRYGQEKGFFESKEPPELLADMLCSGWEGKTYQRALYGLKKVNYQNREEHVTNVLNALLSF